MTDYVLKISSFGGLVPGAVHLRGRVEGPYPKSCHGGITYRDGGRFCSEGHPVPGKIEWDVDAFWTEADYERWRARHYETAGPGQFADEAVLIDTAIRRFRREREPLPFMEADYPAPQPGDRLYLRWLPENALPDDLAEGYDNPVTSKDIRLLAEIGVAA